MHHCINGFAFESVMDCRLKLTVFLPVYLRQMLKMDLLRGRKLIEWNSKRKSPVSGRTMHGNCGVGVSLILLMHLNFCSE
jgi:hypothetical protein